MKIRCWLFGHIWGAWLNVTRFEAQGYTPSPEHPAAIITTRERGCTRCGDRQTQRLQKGLR